MAAPLSLTTRTSPNTWGLTTPHQHITVCISHSYPAWTSDEPEWLQSSLLCYTVVMVRSFQTKLSQIMTHKTFSCHIDVIFFNLQYHGYITLQFKDCMQCLSQLNTFTDFLQLKYEVASQADSKKNALSCCSCIYYFFFHFFAFYNLCQCCTLAVLHSLLQPLHDSD